MAKRAAETKGGYPWSLNPFTTGRSVAWRSASTTPGRGDEGKKDDRNFSTAPRGRRPSLVVSRRDRTRTSRGDLQVGSDVVSDQRAARQLHLGEIRRSLLSHLRPSLFCSPPVRGYTFASKFHFFFIQIWRERACVRVRARVRAGKGAPATALFLSSPYNPEEDKP